MSLYLIVRSVFVVRRSLLGHVRAGILYQGSGSKTVMGLLFHSAICPVEVTLRIVCPQEWSSVNLVSKLTG